MCVVVVAENSIVAVCVCEFRGVGLLSVFRLGRVDGHVMMNCWKYLNIIATI